MSEINPKYTKNVETLIFKLTRFFRVINIFESLCTFAAHSKTQKVQIHNY